MTDFTGRHMDRARELAQEIFDQLHWKIAAKKGEWPVSDLVTDIAAAIRAAAVCHCGKPIACNHAAHPELSDLDLGGSGQSGGTIPESRPPDPVKTPYLEGKKSPIPPLPDRTGGISGYSCPEYFPGRDALPTPDQSFSYYCDRGEGHEGPHHNANVGTWPR